MKRNVGLVVAIVLGVGLALRTQSNAEALEPTGSSSILGQEAALADIYADATAAGALGIYVVGATSEVVAVFPADSGVASSWSPASPAHGYRVRSTAALVTAADVNALSSDLIANASALTAEGRSFGFYFSPEAGHVVIHGDVRAQLLEPILARHPSVGEFTLTSGVTRDSRHSDIVPYSGGSELTDWVTGNCSSGFTVKSNSTGARYLMTAGHCYDIGTELESPGSGNSLGYVHSRATYPTWDLERLFGATYSKYIYVGNATGTLKAVFGAGDPVVGFHYYCRSGWRTAQACNQVVSSLNGTLCDQGCTTGLAVYSGGLNSQFGDSGAPFYLDTLNGVYIRGLHLGRDSGASTMYAHRWSSITFVWNVSIYTGS